MKAPQTSGPRQEQADRWRALRKLETLVDLPMAVLGFVWLTLLIIELTAGDSAILRAVGLSIYVVFLFDFILRLALAPKKTKYLRRNWLTAIALVVPAFRVLRFARAIRAVRAIRLVRVVSSFNRTMGSLRSNFGRRGALYVVSLTIIVVAAGAAGMLAFERDTGGTLQTYGDALWFTGMIITTMGSQYWPVSYEGRVLSFLLSLYALGILGYVTATLASFFLEAQGQQTASDTADAVRQLTEEVALLRRRLDRPDPAKAPLRTTSSALP